MSGKIPESSPAEALADSLAALARRVLGADGVAGLARLSGGATQELWAFDTTGPNPEPLILRRSPGAAIGSGAHIGLTREGEVVRAVHAAGVAVPRVRHVLTPGDDLGQGYVMQRIEGETLGHKIARAPDFAEARKTLAFDCGKAMAQIHAIDLAALPDLPTKPPAGMLAELEVGYRATETPRPVMELALRFLKDRTPAEPRLTLVHGDFRNGNIIVGPEGLRAVLDWELAYVGDPMADLGWICVNSWRFGELDSPVGGFGRREDLFAGYEAGGGARVDPERVRFWEVLGVMRWGLMCAGMVNAYRSGASVSVERPMIARRASETELDLLDLLEA